MSSGQTVSSKREHFRFSVFFSVPQWRYCVASIVTLCLFFRFVSRSVFFADSESHGSLLFFPKTRPIVDMALDYCFVFFYCSVPSSRHAEGCRRARPFHFNGRIFAIPSQQPTDFSPSVYKVFQPFFLLRARAGLAAFVACGAPALWPPEVRVRETGHASTMIFSFTGNFPNPSPSSPPARLLSRVCAAANFPFLTLAAVKIQTVSPERFFTGTLNLNARSQSGEQKLRPGRPKPPPTVIFATPSRATFSEIFSPYSSCRRAPKMDPNAEFCCCWSPRVR